MRTYHEKTGELIENPDLEAGFTYPGERYIGTERIVLEGTVDLYPPGGLGYDKPVYEDCLYYHTYTEDELVAQQPPDEPQPSDGVATWDELATAYSEGGGICMSMDAKTLVLDVLRDLGAREAAELRAGYTNVVLPPN